MRQGSTQANERSPRPADRWSRSDSARALDGVHEHSQVDRVVPVDHGGSYGAQGTVLSTRQANQTALLTVSHSSKLIWRHVIDAGALLTSELESQTAAGSIEL